MPQNPIRWVLTFLFLTLLGLTLWINWALKELEKQKAAGKIKPVGEKVAPAPVEPPPP